MHLDYATLVPCITGENLMLTYVVHSTLNEGDSVGLSQSVKKIMLNYLQVIALARSFSFKMEWCLAHTL